MWCSSPHDGHEKVHAQSAYSCSEGPGSIENRSRVVGQKVRYGATSPMMAHPVDGVPPNAGSGADTSPGSLRPVFERLTDRGRRVTFPPPAGHLVMQLAVG